MFYYSMITTQEVKEIINIKKLWKRALKSEKKKVIYLFTILTKQKFWKKDEFFSNVVFLVTVRFKGRRIL